MNQAEVAPHLGDTPYWIFVSFLYAFIASDLAVRFSKVSSNWSKHEACALGRCFEFWYAPVYSHLVLVSFVVGTSWLGWSQFLQMHTRAFDLSDGVISPSSLLLIVDFAILAMYFVFGTIVNEERLPASCKSKWKWCNGQSSYWVWLILNGYVAWDFAAYFVILPLQSKQHGPAFATVIFISFLIAALPILCLCKCNGDETIGFLWRRIVLVVGAFAWCYVLLPFTIDRVNAWVLWKQSWMSAIGELVAATTFFAFRGIKASETIAMALADASLIALILVYRILKQPSLTSENRWYIPIFLGAFVLLAFATPVRNESWKRAVGILVRRLT